MDALPDDFASALAQVLDPGAHQAAAEVIEAATRLDDEGLRLFLRLLAARVRESSAPVRREELEALLRAARAGAP